MTRPLTNAEENPHAGKGSSVLLDIGDGVGAIVIATPANLHDAEIERRPAGEPTGPPPSPDHDEPRHGHGHGHGHGGRRFPHVAVVPRLSPDGHTIHSAVFFDVPAGRYDLAVLPAGPIQLTVDVVSGRVTEATWPHL